MTSWTYFDAEADADADAFADVFAVDVPADGVVTGSVAVADGVGAGAAVDLDDFSAVSIAESIWVSVGTEFTAPTSLPLTNTVGVPVTFFLLAASLTASTRFLCWSLVTQVE
jgi:hypothetical protein